MTMNNHDVVNDELVKYHAAKPYHIEVIEDETTDNEPVYLALIPELEGCMGQGLTLEEALLDLEEAKMDYIVSLLSDGLEVPTPSAGTLEPIATTTSSPVNRTFTSSNFQVRHSSLASRNHHRLYEANLSGVLVPAH